MPSRINTFEQVATVLASMLQQVTGQAQLTATNTAQFVDQASTLLQADYEPIMNALSVVMTRTLFVSRPYGRRFISLYADAERYGNHTRKVTYLDQPFVENDEYKLVDGQAIDQWTVRKPKVVQFNYYGSSTYEDWTTIFTNQLNTALTGPDEFGRFLAGLMQNIRNKHTQAEETFARFVIANAIAAKCVADTGNIIHLVTEYNAYSGASLTAATVHDPDNIGDFTRWLAGRLKTLVEFMGERSVRFHKSVTAGAITRFTPPEYARVLLNTSEMNQAATRVLTDAFHDDYLKTVSYEPINYWQSITDGEHMSVNAIPSYIDADGVEVIGSQAINPGVDILGVVFDRDFTGYTRVDENMRATPINARGSYSNLWWHWTFRYWQDLTENCVVLALD